MVSTWTAPRQGPSGFDRRHHRPEPGAKGGDAAAGHRLARLMPRGHGWLADHLIRAACAVPVLTAEGAHRASPGSKRQRFSEALGECGEAAAVAELVERSALVRGDEPAAVLAPAGRTVALLTGLVRKFA